jgi:Flp pilus assembly protein TadB
VGHREPNRPPRLGTLLTTAVSFAVGIAGFALALSQVRNLGLKIAAAAFVGLVAVLVIVWYWGYQRGRRD